ncbi:hypothetical protein QR680_006286 [Steinernema hermaphroditum]|uniref:Uncharacterized protein n=1 Tax=Steinernema hermaphroditum TaxID=289476 RepID=A0AA39LWV8_9BILA|nr:hypothetical protein QR680_006286 [Steinernema hermaphroditum]
MANVVFLVTAIFLAIVFGHSFPGTATVFSSDFACYNSTDCDGLTIAAGECDASFSKMRPRMWKTLLLHR